jgi:SpoVK/Ycf46/Vps4 family AAA+-type ATPase
VGLLERFARDIYLHFRPETKNAIIIQVYGGQPVAVQPEEDERIFLPPGLLEDIELQVLAFFDGDETYKRLRLRHRRGFLFVGPPGTGKTMMLRHLIRKCHQLFQPSFCMLRICRRTNEEALEGLFSHALQRTPAMVILEDMDSLTKETMVTRSSLLAQLDGLANTEGLLIVGTTNNAQDIDPALIHRPSRFDRVWHFPLPDDELRLEYLETFFKELSAETIQCLTERTAGWSVAYLKELRTTAALMALGQDLPDVTEDVLLEAFDLLEAQFQAGRKNHTVDQPQCSVGFCEN